MGFKVNFDEKRCKGCGLCTNFCPVKIVHLSETAINEKGYNIAYVSQEEKCVGCTNCATICPDSVITISKEQRKG